MVRLLIRLRAAEARHGAGGSAAALAVAAALGLLSAAGTVVLGCLRYRRPDAGYDVVSFALALWMLGTVAQRALAGGDTTLRPETFAVFPVTRTRLAWSLLAAGVADPALVVVGLASCALVGLAAGGGAAVVLVSLLAAVLTVATTGVLTTVVAGAAPPTARRGRDLGTLVTAVAVSAVSLGGSLYPLLQSALTSGTHPTLTDAVRALPSGWGAAAVRDASAGRWRDAAGWLAGLVAVCAVAGAAWPRLLQHRMAPTRRSAAAARHQLGHRAPATEVGAVVDKELRLWVRDPLRLSCLVIAAAVSVGVCVLPDATGGSPVLLPFAGAMNAVLAGALACNLYGNDGSGIWLAAAAPAAGRTDVRGRQRAFLAVVAPFTVLVTVLLTAGGSGRWWPWSLSLTAAALGAAAGLVPLASLRWVVPLQPGGDPSPVFSLKVHVVLVVVAAGAAPPLALLLSTSGDLRWLAVPAGCGWGSLCAVVGARVAAGWMSRDPAGLLASVTA